MRSRPIFCFEEWGREAKKEAETPDSNKINNGV